MTYQELDNILTSDTNNDPVFQYAGSYDGFVTQTDFVSLDPSAYYTMDDLATYISQYLEETNQDWGATIPTNVVVYKGGIIYPP
jgi:hypothetical protein